MRNEEDIFDEIAQALTNEGLSAGAQDTGGGTLCVVIDRHGGGEIAWGTADINWGATIIGPDGEVESSISTSCPSSIKDIPTIVEAIREPSIRAGAARLAR
jgi:hypothetical protein